MVFMTIDKPEKWQEAIKERALKLLATTPAVMTENTPQQVVASNLIPRFQLSCRQGMQNGVRAAMLAGWRTLLFVGEGETPVAAIDFTNQGDTLEVEGCTEGDSLESFVKGLEIAERVSGTVTFEVRLLESPGLLFTSLWLHRDDQDILIPLVDEGPLRAFKDIPLEDADGILRDKAERQLIIQKRFREAQVGSPLSKDA